MIDTLKDYTDNISVYDPWADKQRVSNELGIELIDSLRDATYAAVVHCVAHEQFTQLDVRSLLRPGGVVFDVKGTLDRSLVDDRL